MRMLSGAFIAVGFLSSGAVAAENESQTLEPSSNWALNHLGERCTLSRILGSGQEGTTIQISSFGSYSDFRIILFGGALPASNKPSSEVRYKLTADATERGKVDALNGTLGGAPLVSFEAYFRAYKPERDSKESPIERRLTLSAQPEVPSLELEQQITALTVEFEDGTQLDLQLGSMAEPLGALRHCIDDLRKSWGLDPAQERTLTRYPVPNMRSVNRLQRNYPEEMIRAGASAYVPVRIMVNERGRAEECIVQSSSVHAEFQAAACSGLATQYSPALDESGQPVASVFPVGVVFLLKH